MSVIVTELQYAAITLGNNSCQKKLTTMLYFHGLWQWKKRNLQFASPGGIYLPQNNCHSPYNSLLPKHKIQSHQYLRRTNMPDISFLPFDVQKQGFLTHFDVLFISIHIFGDLMVGYRNSLTQWKLQSIFMNEYHNVVSVRFGLSSLWHSLCLIASLNAKMTILSATTVRNLMRNTLPHSCQPVNMTLWDWHHLIQS